MIAGKTIPVINPATEEAIGHIAHAEKADLDLSIKAAEHGFNIWKAIPPFERSKVMRRAAELLRERVEQIAIIMTTEQGRPLAQARIGDIRAFILFFLRRKRLLGYRVGISQDTTMSRH